MQKKAYRICSYVRGSHFEGKAGLVCRFIMGIAGVIVWPVVVTSIKVTKSP